MGRDLAALTGYKLFHNHMSIDPILEVFDWGTPSFSRLTSELRSRVVEEAVIADLPGLIFTFVWDFADPADRARVDQLTEPVRAAGSRVSFVELYTDQAARLAREGTQLRLEHKRGKRDVERSRRLSRSVDAEGRLNTDGDFYYPDAHLRLDNTDLSPRAAAEYIAAELDLSRSR